MPTDERYAIRLLAVGPDKMEAVRRLRELAGLGLAKALYLTDYPPAELLQGADRAKAEALVAALRAIGCELEVDPPFPLPAPVAPPPLVAAPPPAEPPAVEPPPAEPLAVEPPPPPPVASGDYAVILRDCGPNKIMVIKAIRELTGLGLKDAKDLAEAPGSLVKAYNSPALAITAQIALMHAGATAELIQPPATPAVDPTDGPCRVHLLSSGERRIEAIKAIRDATGLGLAVCKAVIDGAPEIIPHVLDRDAAEDLIEALDAVGATATLAP